MRRLISAVTLTLTAAGLAAFAAAGTAQAAAPPPPKPVGNSLCRTAVTHLVARPDSGNHGDWALDTMTRTVHICMTAVNPPPPAPPVKSAALAVVPPAPVLTAQYHATVSDTGSFVTLTGHSPNAGLALTAGIHGHLHGGYSADFTAEALFKTYKGTFDGGTYSGTAPSSTGDWLKNLWGAPDFTITPANNLVGWSWTYWTCTNLPPRGEDALKAGHAGRYWVDAYNNNSGEGILAGDIWARDCPVTHPSPQPHPSKTSPSPCPSVSKSHSSPAPSASTAKPGGVVVVSSSSAAGTVLTGESGKLPVTGSSTALIAAAGLILVAGGTALFAWTRRRRTRFEV